jgi:POT family proton-dependent oligopeptide transporter
MIKNTDYRLFYVHHPLAILHHFPLWNKEGRETSRKKLIAMYIHPFLWFWAFYEQSGGSLALFCKEQPAFFEINPNIVNSIKFICIILI